MALNIEGRNIFFIWSIVFFLLFCCSFSKADFIPLLSDTLRVGGGFYASDTIYVNPGQCRVPVTIYLKNTLDIAGFLVRVVYDSAIMCPRSPVPESSYSQPPRSQDLSLFAGNFEVPEQISFFGARFLSGEIIATGQGPIVEFYFNIKSTAPQGCSPIRLEDDTLNNPDNYITDTLGIADYLPVLENGFIYVSGPTFFQRGDANGDSSLAVSDAIYLINYLFKAGPAPDPLRAGDANCDNEVSVSDVIYLINYLFKGGPPPSC